MSNTIEFATQINVLQMSREDIASKLNGLSLIEYFNSITLTNQIVKNYDVLDDGVDIIPLNWFEDAYFSITPEGVIGITVPSWEKRDSGYTFNRMYNHNNIEPDVFSVLRGVGDNYADFSQVKYNDDRLICIQSINRPISGVIYTSFSYNPEINQIIIDECYIDIDIDNTNTMFEIGCKFYDRIETQWSPFILSSATSPLLKAGLYDITNGTISTEEYNIYDLNQSNIIKFTDDLYDKRYIKNVGNFNVVNTRINNTSNEFINHKSNLKSYNNNYNIANLTEGDFYNFFIEGLPDIPVSLTASIDHQVTFNMKSNTNNFILNQLNLNNLKISANGNYNKIVSPRHDLNMVKGYIKGDINISNCGTSDKSKFIIRCFRESDNFLIGEYSIINDEYNIPNLNANDRYTIILIDTNHVLKQRVISYIQPKSYIEHYIPTKVSILNNKSKLIWYVEGSKYWDKIEIFERSPDNEYDILNPFDILTNALSYDDSRLKHGNFYKIKISGNNQSIESNETLFLKETIQ